MATIIRQTMIDVSPAEAWAALRDFGAVHRRLAVGFVAECTLDAPDVRTISFSNGAVAKEHLVGVDEGARRLAYSVSESALMPAHHNAAAEILEGAEGTRFVWTTDVLPDDLAPSIAGLMDTGIAAIKLTLERGDVEGAAPAPTTASPSSEEPATERGVPFRRRLRSRWAAASTRATPTIAGAARRSGGGAIGAM
jgi:hypothetical protein